MHRTGITLICALLAGPLLVSCNQPLDPPAAAGSSGSPVLLETPVQSVADVDPAVQQRVKNICVEQLQAQASGAVPGPKQLHPQKIKLVKVAFLGEIKEISLPGSATGYELGIEFAFKMGNDDARSLRKYCRTNLNDSTVEWQGMTSP
jgi:hypothetical protein